ncbi:MAG: hypothetical protein ACI8QC_003845 [Planctomycetota bacterium]
MARPSLNAGNGTMRDFLGEEGTKRQGTLEEEKVTARQGSGKSSFTQTKVANDGSRSQAQEKEVYLASKKAAEDSIQRQDIPAGYQRYVRKYFEGIEPEKAESKEEDE